MRILIMREHWHGGLACIQSFGRRGHYLTVGVENNPSIHTKSDFVSRVISMSQDGDPVLRATLLCDLVDESSFDLVVPISDADAETVAHAAQMRPDCSAFVTPTVATIELARDRDATWKLCRELDIEVPNAKVVTAQTLLKAANDLGYPCFLKFSGEAASEGVFEILSQDDVLANLARLKRDGSAQLQEAVFGDFFGVTAFCIDGEMTESMGFRTEYKFSKVGTPPFAWHYENSALNDLLRKIVKRLNWTGGIDLDLLQRPDGELVVLEINPRLSGTVNLALALGIDLPKGYLQAVGDPAPDRVFPLQEKELFISLVEEARWRAKPKGARLANDLRHRYNFADNGYRDDLGYSRALRRKLRDLRKAEWKERTKAWLAAPFAR